MLRVPHSHPFIPVEQVVKQQAQSARLVFREAKPERLDRFAVAAGNYEVALVQVQAVDLEGLPVRPRDRWRFIDLDGQLPRVA